MITTQRLNALEQHAAAMSTSEPCRTCGAPQHRSECTSIDHNQIGGACSECGRLLCSDGKPYVAGPNVASILMVGLPKENPRLIYGEDDKLRLMPEDVPVWLDSGHPIHISCPAEPPVTPGAGNYGDQS